MIMTPLITRSTRALEFGIYRDGDNNLDDIQHESIAQALEISERNHAIEFTVEDTTGYDARHHRLSTEEYSIADGTYLHLQNSRPHNMADRGNLAQFVARTLDNAQAAGAKQTWIDLVDHGGGDGGGLEADSSHGVMRADDIAGAIGDGVALHAQRHPKDATRGVDGVLANQCLMATLGFSDALSHAGVRYLAASPETMLAPGAPTNVAESVARYASDPKQMAKAIVSDAMDSVFDAGLDRYHTAAAFDAIDLDPAKIATMENDVAALNAAIVKAAHSSDARAAIRQDARAIDGMVRDDHTGLPWHADRPAIELYRTFASDGRLDSSLRNAACAAADSVAATVLAHRESGSFEPFGGASYADAIGPTVHFPVTQRQIDPWKPAMSETDNAFYQRVGGLAVARAIA